MTHLQRFDSTGLSHVSNQGIIELAYQDKLDNAIFEWQDANSKDQFTHVSRYLDSWPFEFKSPDASSREWFTPSLYQQIDLQDYALSRCKNEIQTNRARDELAIIDHLQAEHIFKHLIYLVDKWRSENRVWGVGRGSSVSCFVLYLIGINKINPLDYDLSMTEFFKIEPDRVLNKNKLPKE